jgi:teichuronic acid biosynthesis glycosyltransferase TuaG
MPLVSVIVTTYNRRDLLTKTIDSILKQTYKNFELIVVDNFSDYDFLSYLRSFNDERIRSFQNVNDGIIAVNRNFGIKKAKGDYIAFCDDDDKWMPEKLEKQMKFIIENQLENKSIVLYTNCINTSEKTRMVTSKRNINNINDLIKRNQITYSSTLISSINLKRNFNENSEFIAVEDFLFWCSLAVDGYKYFLIKDNLVIHRINSDSMSMQNIKFKYLSAITVLMYLVIKNKDMKINHLILGYSVIVHIVKYIITVSIQVTKVKFEKFCKMIQSIPVL